MKKNNFFYFNGLLFKTGKFSERPIFQMTLGSLIEKLSKCDQRKGVYINYPLEIGAKGLISYRGIYAELAIDFGIGWGMPAGELLFEAKNAVGKTFEGYKGGEFLMEEKTPVWISAYSLSSGMGLFDVVEKKNHVLLRYKKSIEPEDHRTLV